MPGFTLDMENLSGTLSKIKHFNAETGFFVAEATAPGRAREFKIVGSAPAVSSGESFTARGVWETTEWGAQFKIADIKLTAPSSAEGICKFLVDSVEGVGPKLATSLVEHFGEETFDVIEHHPERLSELPNFGPKRASALVAACKKSRDIRELMVFLRSCGLSGSKASRVHDRWGADAATTVKSDPYKLTDVWGIGFLTADAAARKMGIPADSMSRIGAALRHVLDDAEGSGNCGLPVIELAGKATALLGVGPELVQQVLTDQITDKRIYLASVEGELCAFNAKMWALEQRIADRLAVLTHPCAVVPVGTTLEALVDSEAAKLNPPMVLEGAQREAALMALRHQACVITGGPGTGKTTLIRVLLACLKSAGFTKIALCAPTGRAAQRMRETTGHPSATLHRLLGFAPPGGFKHNAQNPLDVQVLVVDEFSMMDVRLTAALLDALPPTARIIQVGDADQLPSVGPGRVLLDILESGAVPSTRLTVVRRQGKGSDLVEQAHKVNAGEVPRMGYVKDSDFYFRPMSPKVDTPEDKQACRLAIADELVRIVKNMKAIGHDPVKDVQVLLPMYDGPLGVSALNGRLQKELNPSPSAVVETKSQRLGVGDKVMQLRNNYTKNVFNGDIGLVIDVDPQKGSLGVAFDSSELPVVYSRSELDELALAYAISTHKSQGSEFPVVLTAVDSSHYVMLERNLLYTAMTRARKLFILLGQPKSVSVAVRRVTTASRHSRLKTLLQEHVQGNDGLDVDERALLAELDLAAA